jgi:hypothetical protein
MTKHTTALSEKIRNALFESRILILAGQFMLGFGFHAVFQPGFSRVSELGKNLHVASFVLVVISFTLLTSAASYHRLIEKGRASESLYEYMDRFMKAAVLPLGLAMALTLYEAGEMHLGNWKAAAFALVNASFALFFWCGLELSAHKQRHKHERAAAR